MRMIATLSALVILVGALAGDARAGDVQTVEAIDDAAGMLDEATRRKMPRRLRP